MSWQQLNVSVNFASQLEIIPKHKYVISTILEVNEAEFLSSVKSYTVEFTYTSLYIFSFF